jgi:hypothetical protein
MRSVADLHPFRVDLGHHGAGPHLDAEPCQRRRAQHREDAAGKVASKVRASLDEKNARRLR